MTTTKIQEKEERMGELFNSCADKIPGLSVYTKVRKSSSNDYYVQTKFKKEGYETVTYKIGEDVLSSLPVEDAVKRVTNLINGYFGESNDDKNN